MNAQRWRTWFLVIGILTLVVNPISAVLYLMAFSSMSKEPEVKIETLKVENLAPVDSWKIQSALDDLSDWGILSDSEEMTARGELLL